MIVAARLSRRKGHLVSRGMSPPPELNPSRWFGRSLVVVRKCVKFVPGGPLYGCPAAALDKHHPSKDFWTPKNREGSAPSMDAPPTPERDPGQRVLASVGRC